MLKTRSRGFGRLPIAVFFISDVGLRLMILRALANAKNCLISANASWAIRLTPRASIPSVIAKMSASVTSLICRVPIAGSTSLENRLRSDFPPSARPVGLSEIIQRSNASSTLTLDAISRALASISSALCSASF
ncbi:hypothetical protein D3C80_1407930 [compost metagenome]